MHSIPAFSSLDTTIAVLFLIGAIVYGVFGWRLISYLAVMDVMALSLYLGRTVHEIGIRNHMWLVVLPLCAVVVVGVPWLAWRHKEIAVYAMCGLVGFALVQLLIVGEHNSMLIRIMLGSVGAMFAMAAHMTLGKHTAIVVTSLHGGWLIVAAMEVLAQTPQSFFNRLMVTLNTASTMLVPLTVLVLAAIMTAIQWADMERSRQPV